MKVRYTRVTNDPYKVIRVQSVPVYFESRKVEMRFSK